MVDESRADPGAFVRRVLAEGVERMETECWHAGLAVSFAKRAVRSALSRFLSEGLGTTGRVDRSAADQVMLCGLSVERVDHVFRELGRIAGVQSDPGPLSDLQLARLLQVQLI